MPTLMGLPNEVLISIVDATGPEDVVSFSTCCKLMYNLARDRLEDHKKKKGLFSTILVEDYFKPDPQPFPGKKYGDSDTYVKQYFSDERNRLYPKIMVVELDPDEVAPMEANGGSRRARTSTINYLNEYEHQVEWRMAEVYDTIALEVGGVEAEDWGKDVKAGSPLATFLLLLALLPNLEELNINIFGDWPRTFSASYSKIMRLVIEAASGQDETGLRFGARLSKCSVDGNDCENIGESLLPFIMMLPKMKSIQGYCLDLTSCSWPYANAVSPVTDLELHGAIHPETLGNYIRGIRELKRFGFTYAGIENMFWEPCSIVAALRQFSFRSLVNLSLTTEVSQEVNWASVSGGAIWRDISPGIGSLRSFEVLDTVQLHYVLLLEEVLIADSADDDSADDDSADDDSADDDNADDDSADEVNSAETSENLNEESLVKAQHLIDFLPSSVRVFKLHQIAEGNGVLDAFQGFPEHRVERLPNLELIQHDASNDINNQIEKICKETGVQINKLFL